jgi:hypothetical protein
MPRRGVTKCWNCPSAPWPRPCPWCASSTRGARNCRKAFRPRCWPACKAASTAASKAWSSSTGAAMRRCWPARPAAGSRAAGAAPPTSCCTWPTSACAATTAASRPPFRAPARLRQRRPAALRARHAAPRSHAGRTLPRRPASAHRPRLGEHAEEMAGLARHHPRGRGRHPGRHPDAGQGPRFPAADAGRRGRRRCGVVRRRLPRPGAALRATDAGRRPQRPCRPARRSADPDRVSRPSAVPGADRPRLRALRAKPARRTPHRRLSALQLPGHAARRSARDGAGAGLPRCRAHSAPQPSPTASRSTIRCRCACSA